MRGLKVRVRKEHRIAERRGMVGNGVGKYGGEEYVVVDVRFPDRQRRWLFWPEDLEEVRSSRRSWWSRKFTGERLKMFLP